MLRLFYLLNLLIYISFCCKYSEANDPNNGEYNRRLRENEKFGSRKRVEHRRTRNRRDYDEADDKDEMAQIDVASFIKDSEEASFDDDPYDFQLNKRKLDKNINYHSVLEKNTNEKENEDDYYSESSEDLLQNSELTDNLLSKDQAENQQKRNFDNLFSNNLDNNLNKFNSKPYPKRKCALKIIKFPFFSHNKSTSTKSTKERKRRLNTPNTHKKENFILKTDTENLATENTVPAIQNLHENDELNILKRSYFERLCPVCKRKFIVNAKKLRSIYNLRRSNDNVGSNIRNEGDTRNMQNLNTNDYNVEKIDVNEPIYLERRKREDDNRNIERQKELEDLEKRVESVSVNNPVLNNVESKA